MKKQFNKIELDENLPEIYPIKVIFKDGKNVFDFSKFKTNLSRLFAKVFYEKNVILTIDSRRRNYYAINRFLKFISEKEIQELEKIDAQLIIYYASHIDQLEWSLSTKYKNYNTVENYIVEVFKLKNKIIKIPTNPFLNVASERKVAEKLSIEKIRKILKICYAEIEESYLFIKETENKIKELTLTDFDEKIMYDRKELIHITYYFYKKYGYLPSYGKLSNVERHLVNLAGGSDNVLKGITPNQQILLPYYLVLLIELAGNPDAIRQMKNECIKEDILFEDRCFIVWDKGRSNAEQKRNVLKKKKFGAYQIIELLKEITQNTRNLADRKQNECLFLGRIGSEKNELGLISQENFNNSLKLFIKKHNLDFSFNFNQIRPSMLTHIYRSRKDITSVFKIANHKNINTTLLYVIDDEIKKENIQYMSEKQEQIISSLFQDKKIENLDKKIRIEKGENIGFICENPIIDKKVCSNWMTELTNPNLIIPNNSKYLSKILALKNEIEKGESFINKDRFNLLYKPILDTINNQIVPKFSKEVIKESKNMAQKITIPMFGDD